MSSASNAAGSYDFTSFGNESGELERLQLQAQRSARLELQMLERMGLADGQAVLDLACGPGVISRLIAQAHPQSRVTAMDLNGELLAAARQEATTAGLTSIRFLQGDVYKVHILQSFRTDRWCKSLWSYWASKLFWL